MIDDPVEPDEPTIEEERDYYKALAEDLQARLKVAETALADALIPLAVLKITEADKPYIEHSPSLKASLRKAHDSTTAALAEIRREG